MSVHLKQVFEICFLWNFQQDLVDLITVVSLTTVIGVPVSIVTSGFSLAFSIFIGIVKNLLKQQQIKGKSMIKLLEVYQIA